MKKYIFRYSILFLINSIMFSCQSKKQSGETNTSVNLTNRKEVFPDQKTAFENVNNNVDFYEPSGNKIFSVDLRKSLYKVDLISIFYSEHLSKINDQLYFLPKKINAEQTFATGNTGSAEGNFTYQYEINELGLATKEKVEFPANSRVKVNDIIFEYNKFGQLLKVIQNKKPVIQNAYNEVGHLIESKNPEKSSKLKYNEDLIVIEERQENGVKTILKYQYNAAKQLVKKSSDDQTYVEKFNYDDGGRLVSIVRYSAEIDKDNTNKLINHFTKISYNYTNTQLTEEKVHEYKIVNASVLADKKWQPLNIEQQRKIAWEKLNDPTGIPVSEIERIYRYKENGIVVKVNHFSFSNRITNGKANLEKEISNSQSIKFSFDNTGKIVKKETTDKNNRTISETYSY